jgi:hypothetical protein
VAQFEWQDLVPMHGAPLPADLSHPSWPETSVPALTGHDVLDSGVGVLQVTDLVRRCAETE